MSVVPDVLPVYRFRGTHREIGRQYGEACVDLIQRHRDLALVNLKKRHGADSAEVFEGAERYRSYVRDCSPEFDEEIQGVAEGAKISLAEAYLLQLRAELTTLIKDQRTLVGAVEDHECTTFAALGETTRDGAPLIGQNMDLPAFYREYMVVLELVPDDAPAALIVTPAGQISYGGINDRGLGVFANFITCDGWRLGYPRYLLSRLALSYETTESAISAMTDVERASSRNFIMVDAHNTAADLETTPTRVGRLDPVDGLVAHSNHFVVEELLDEERASPEGLENSRTRLDRMNELLAGARGQLTPELAQEFMRDRARDLHNICRVPGDNGDFDSCSAASVVASPTTREVWVAAGPPNEHPYVRHTFELA